MYQRQVSFGEAISRAFNNYANFNGRASRSEYWWFALFNFILGCIPFVNFIAGLALIIPSLALGARRLHDTGRSGWWLLLGLIPFLGGLVLIVFFCQESHPMVNEYGPVPNTDDNNGGGWNNGGYNNGGYNNGGNYGGGYNNGGYNNGGNYGGGYNNGGYNNGGNYGGGNNGWGNNNNGAIRR